MEQFLEQDHEASMQLLSQAEAELNRTTELSERRDDLSRRYGSTRLEVYHWEEAWRTVKACHRFLLRVSPLSNDDVDSAVASHSRSSYVKSPEIDDDYDYDTSLESLIGLYNYQLFLFKVALG